MLPQLGIRKRKMVCMERKVQYLKRPFLRIINPNF